jgi:hypothetical protein
MTRRRGVDPEAGERDQEAGRWPVGLRSVAADRVEAWRRRENKRLDLERPNPEDPLNLELALVWTGGGNVELDQSTSLVSLSISHFSYLLHPLKSVDGHSSRRCLPSSPWCIPGIEVVAAVVRDLLQLGILNKNHVAILRRRWHTHGTGVATLTTHEIGSHPPHHHSSFPLPSIRPSLTPAWTCKTAEKRKRRKGRGKNKVELVSSLGGGSII